MRKLKRRRAATESLDARRREYQTLIDSRLELEKTKRGRPATRELRVVPGQGFINRNGRTARWATILGGALTFRGKEHHWWFSTAGQGLLRFTYNKDVNGYDSRWLDNLDVVIPTGSFCEWRFTDDDLRAGIYRFARDKDFPAGGSDIAGLRPFYSTRGDFFLELHHDKAFARDPEAARDALEKSAEAYVTAGDLEGFFDAAQWCTKSPQLGVHALDLVQKRRLTPDDPIAAQLLKTAELSFSANAHVSGLRDLGAYYEWARQPDQVRRVQALERAHESLELPQAGEAGPPMLP